MIFFSGLKRYRQFKDILIVDDYSFSGGGSRPIYTYYRQKLVRGEHDALLLRLATRGAFFKLFLLLFFRNRLIINSLVPFKYWMIHLACLLKKDVIIYLHEAAPHTEPFKKRYPMKFKSAKRFLRTKKVAFVSEWQRQYFLDMLPLKNTSIVYSVVQPTPVVPRKDHAPVVAMIGFQTINKNPDFFSKVADLSAAQGKPLQFVWLGSDGGDQSRVYHSPNVYWVGEYDQVMDFLNDVDIFFFTSQADCFPLSMLEAIGKKKRIVTYKENGMASMLRDVRGSRVFDEFDEPAVLRLLEDVMQEQVDSQRYDAIMNDVADFDKLKSRLEELFQRPKS